MAGDLALLDQWMARRDAEAFRTLVTRHGGMVFNTCKRILGNEAEAEEITQECFEALAVTQRKPSRHLAAWPHRVAAHKAIHRVESESRRKAREKAYADAQPTSEEIGWDDVYPAVDEALAALPDKYRECLLLHFFEGQSHYAMAGLLQCPRTTVTSRVNRGVVLLRKDLARRGIPVAGAALGVLLTEHAGAAALPEVLAGRLARLALSGAKVGGAVKAGAALGTGFFTAGKVWLTVALVAVVLILGAAVFRTPGDAAEGATLVEPTPAKGDTQPTVETPVSPVAAETVLPPNDTPPLTIAAEDVPTEVAPQVDGLWSLTVRFRNPDTNKLTTEQGEPFAMVQTGSEVRMENVKDSSFPTLIGQLEDRHMTMLFGDSTLSGTFNSRFDRLRLSGQAPAGMPLAGQTIWLLFAKIEADPNEAACEKHQGEVKKLASALKSFAEDNEGAFPARLQMLYPHYISDASVTAPSDSREVAYFPNVGWLFEAASMDWNAGEAPGATGPLSCKDISYEADAAPVPEQLLAIEESRHGYLGNKLPWPKELYRCRFTDSGCAYRIKLCAGELTVEGVPSPEERASDAEVRATCANNLKYLGLVYKIFANENGGYLLPGWYTVYPDYLTDLSIVNCPKDPAGTESYDIFFPATHDRYFFELAIAVTGRDLSQAEAEALVPIMADRHVHNDAEPGRNVLFADGHVNFVKQEEWATRVAPYLAH